VKTLLPLFQPTDPEGTAWLAALTAAADRGDPPGPAGVAAIVGADGPDLKTLADAGVTLLGHIDLAFATRYLREVLAEVAAWSRYPIQGIFFDRAPTTPYAIGPVAAAMGAARRAGLETLVLNPGVPTDSLYRVLQATICTFEGSWSRYRDWSGEGVEPGDGHLVHEVPVAQTQEAAALMRERGAGLGLITDRSGDDWYAAIPAWCATAPRLARGWARTGRRKAATADARPAR
jgi:spherulation-specific family 4 protein